jgi:hypothetical protein
MRYICLLTMICFVPCQQNETHAGQRVLEAKLKHLRAGTQREWANFPQQPDAESLVLKFDSHKNKTKQTLRLRQQDVKQTWRVLLNGIELGRLHRNENDMRVNWPVPAGSLVEGENTLTIQQSGRITSPDDIRVGEIVLDDRPPKDVLSEAAVQITVLDSRSNQPTPCRITVLDVHGTLVSVGATSNRHMAVRPGVIYSGDGHAKFGLPAGRYVIYAGRGFEYGIDSVNLAVRKGETVSRTLTIGREVPTEGWVSCDTHVHTLTHSGHGDASIEERMLTLAGEGLELPIATDHNKHIDYETIATKMGVRQYFTPVIGNEVTTKVGHFNIFPVKSGAPIPNYRLTDWQQIADEIFQTDDVKVAILNHARDNHGGFRPFGPKHHNGLIGKNLDGWKLRANAMELINSGAQQTDVMQLYRDWFGLLNRGVVLTPVGCSDSHDVARHFVGQARTYIRCKDSNPQKIDINEAVENFADGKVMVSCGLLAEITVDGKYGPGELVPVSDEVSVSVRVLGPSWTTAEVVELYQNGRKIREHNIAKGTASGVKWSGTWTLPRPKHDVHLVVVARGPGVKELYWPIAKPYQPTSPVLDLQVVGSSGAVWIDADGNGKRNSAFYYATQIVQQEKYHPKNVLKKLGRYDESIAAQAAGLLQEHGVSLTDQAFRAALNTAKPQVQQGIRSYLEAWRETQRARLERE